MGTGLDQGPRLTSRPVGPRTRTRSRRRSGSASSTATRPSSCRSRPRPRSTAGPSRPRAAASRRSSTPTQDPPGGAYLINAVYFNAQWTHRFRESDTRPAPFHLADGTTVVVPMMYQEGTFDARYDADVSMLRLPFGAHRFSMVLALPRGSADPGTVAARLEAGR